MSYNAIAQAAQDQDLRLRIAACIAQQQLTDDRHPVAYADAIQWQVAANPAVSDAYTYAVNMSIARPGRDEGAVTDAMILAAVSDLEE